MGAKRPENSVNENLNQSKRSEQFNMIEKKNLFELEILQFIKSGKFFL